MSVSNYTPNESLCRYNYSKLKNVIYLVDKYHLKNVHIDNGEAYIDGLTQLPLRLNGFSIQLNEESSLDERYKFRKTVTLSMNGYVNHTIFGERYYVILESFDGTYWMVNVDFPSDLTYTFNLAKDVYQTDFTLSSLSNFPTLKLNADFEAVEPECIGFNTFGIDSLKLLEKEYCALDTVNKKVDTYGREFKTIEFLGDSCSMTETYDGNNVTTTISFDIAFDAYKSSWHYTLLEFMKNLYSAIITPNGKNNQFFAGFNYGLQPSFTVETSTEKGQSDIITVTLREMSQQGTLAENDWEEEHSTETRWSYTKWVGTVKCYECVARARARYLVQEEVYANGSPTGNYKVLEGYEEYYQQQGLNVIGTFTNEEQFGTSECGGSQCNVITNLPLSITYTATTCYTYSYSASCDWNVTNLPSYITVSPNGGSGGVQYELTVCNTKTPVSTEQSAFEITSGDNTRVVNVILTTQSGILQPQTVNLNCLPQNATFTFNSLCPITVTSIDQRMTYQITNSQLIVNVPRNNSTTSAITYAISVIDCKGNNQTVHIIQDMTYERWVNAEGFICESGDSYTVQERYTGTTQDSINVKTGERRKGTLIQSGDTKCSSSQTRWRFDGSYYCVNGNKYEAEEEEISYNGQTWMKTGQTRLGQLVETSSEFCDETLNPVEYEWRITTLSQCENVTPPTPSFNGKWLATYTGGTTSSAECDSTSAITNNEITKSGLTSVEIGGCVTSISNSAFTSATTLSSVTIPNSVTSIGNTVFYGCGGLQSVIIPDSVTSIGEYAFTRCSGLTSVTIGSGVTSIGRNAFGSCGSLTSVTIPSGLTTIGVGAFYSCTGLTSITIPDSVTSISGSAFERCSGLTSVNIPNDVTSIYYQTFRNCTSLTSITIPSGVTTIGYSAFESCTSLTSITVLATTPPSLESYVFDNTNNCPIYVPAASLTDYQSAWSTYASRIQAIPS